jgi:WD40 repeat protein
LITLCNGGNIYAWNLSNGEKVNQIKCDKNVNYIISFRSRDGFLTGAENGEMKYWRSWDVVSTLKGHTASIINVVSLSCTISSLSQDGTIRIWRLESGECLQKLSALEGPYKSLKIFQNDQIAALCSNGFLHIIDRTDKDECKVNI